MSASPSACDTVGRQWSSRRRVRAVQAAAVELAQPGLGEDRLDRRARGGLDPGQQVEHAGLELGADVEGRRRPEVVERGEVRVHHVGHGYVVARLAAVAEDARLLALEQEAEEDRDDAGLAVGILARPEHVAVAQDDVAGAVQPVVEQQVLLGAELRDAVRRHRRRRGGLGRGDGVDLAVDRPARRREHHPGVVGAGGLEHLDGASTFTLASNTGSSTDTRTSAWAARWNTACGLTSSNSARTPERSRMSSSVKPAPAGMRSRRPCARLSTMVTSSPRASSPSATCEPMKPAPPVTIARMGIAGSLTQIDNDVPGDA